MDSNAAPGILSTLEAISQFLFPLVLIAGGIACRTRLNSPRPREGWIVGMAIGMFVFRLLVMVLVALLASLILPPLFEMSTSMKRKYRYVHWWHGTIVMLIDSSFYAAAWAFLLYAAFGPGSDSQSRYLNEAPKDASSD